MLIFICFPIFLAVIADLRVLIEGQEGNLFYVDAALKDFLNRVWGGMQ